MGESIMSNKKIAIGGSINYMGFSYISAASGSTSLETETKYHAVPINLSGIYLFSKFNLISN